MPFALEGMHLLPLKAINLPTFTMFGTSDTSSANEEFMLEEHFFQCPYCWEEISMVLDLSVGRQTYVEDCEVCCRPIEVRYEVEDDDIVEFNAKILE